MVKKIWYSYNDIHLVLQELAAKIKNAPVKYDAMIAIGGGGFIPARILRSFLHIPIYAVTTAYYESEQESKTTDRVRKIQWLDPMNDSLRGKNVLVVDEVDDSRVTMAFVLQELAKEGFNEIGIAVLHEKIKPKQASLPENVHYFSGTTVPDWWINYPWDAEDIEAHNRLAADSQGFID